MELIQLYSRANKSTNLSFIKYFLVSRGWLLVAITRKLLTLYLEVNLGEMSREKLARYKRGNYFLLVGEKITLSLNEDAHFTSGRMRNICMFIKNDGIYRMPL